jgi:anti-sigma B factor antagonist
MVESQRVACSDPAQAQVPKTGRRPVARGQDDGASLRKDPVLDVEDLDGGCLVRLGGELDLYNAQFVRKTLFDVCETGPERLVVDLSQVEFMDSTALGVLIEARSRLPNRRAFFLAAPGLETRRALEISGLDRHFAVYDTVPEALAAKP